MNSSLQKSQAAAGETSTASFPTAPLAKAVRCPGCEHIQWSNPWVVPGQPAVLNYRCHTVAEAKKIPLQDLHLVECPECGLIFNSAFDKRLVPYDEGYDNCQSFSSVFLGHMEDCARHLATHYPAPESSMVVEPGCGKGAYLQLLCRLTGWHGVGYDTTCENSTGALENQRVRFIRRYATPDDIRDPVHAMVCRHVIEHVGNIGAFLGELHALATAGNVRVVYLETPAWEWIAEAGAFWDIFHEHCNYFTMAALRRLSEQAGFQVLEHFTTFGGQYQSLYLGIREESPPSHEITPPSPAGLEAFAQTSHAARNALRQRLAGHGADRLPYAIWGAGAKGVTLANTLHHLQLPPSVLIDCNPGKAGTFIPGLGLPVRAPAPDALQGLPLIVVSNPNYLPEIAETLRSMSLNPTLIPV